jgi:transposase
LPGNVADVTTLRKLLRDLQDMDMGKVKLVLDRGFYSARNIDALFKHRCKKDMLAEQLPSLHHPHNASSSK